MKVIKRRHPSHEGAWMVVKSLFGALLAAGMGVFLFLYTKSAGFTVVSIRQSFSLFTLKAALAAALIFLVSGAVVFVCCRFSAVVGELLYRFRYPLALLVLVVCVACNLNGSSLGMFSDYLPGGGDSGLLLGSSKSIRSDEWAVNTPMAFAQYFNKEGGAFPYFNTTMRGTVSDSFIVYGQPVWDIAVLFRPFHWGYLLLGPVYGLSFFWCARLIALFMVTFELGMLLTGKNKALSLAMSFLVAFAPVVQWWFAVNGLVEMFVFGGLAVLILHRFLITERTWLRIVLMPLLAVCGGGYILTIYPSWQIPLGYVFLTLVICVIMMDRRECRFRWKRDVPVLMIFVVLLAGGMAYVLTKSMDTILAVTGTVYPGNRTFTGGGAGMSLFAYPASSYFPVTNAGLTSNVCEAATFYDFFPMGLLLGLFAMVKNRRRDALTIGLLVVWAVLFAFCAFSWPELLAKLSLLSNCQPERVLVALGFVNLFLLFRAMALLEDGLPTMVSAVAAVAVSAVVIYFSRRAMEPYLGVYKGLLAGLLLAGGCYLIFRRHQKLFVVACVVVAFWGGMVVNPVRQGADVVMENPLYQSVREIAGENDGVWLVEGMGFPVPNLPVMAGAPTLNSTNVYPNLALWQKLDPDGGDEEIYNRYAHITVNFVKEETKMELLQADSILLSLNTEDLPLLNIRYVLTSRDLTSFNSKNLRFEQLKQVGEMRIYECKGA